MELSMTAHGQKVDITTYTGGCGTGIVDVNPHLVVKEQGKVCVSIELVDANGARLTTSGIVYEDFVYPSEIGTIHWRASAPHGGTHVHVYADMDGEVTKDTAQCRT
jgi:hypothetical protein